MIPQNVIINEIIERCGFESYLEIGVDKGITFQAVRAQHKESCDITDNNLPSNLKLTYKMTSDEMFIQMPTDKKFDLIFVDALHHEEYCDRDIVNSLKHINKGGFVVVHDVCPYNKSESVREFNGGEWMGDVFKSICKLHTYDGLEYCTLFEYFAGVAVLRYNDKCSGYQYPGPCEYTYDDIFIENNAVDMNHLTALGKRLYNPVRKDEFLATLKRRK